MRLPRTCVGVWLALFAFCGPQRVHAQTLDDWKQALEAKQSGKGCESIPYSNYRDECSRKQERVEEKCGKNGEKWNCDSLGTRSLKEQIKGISEKLEELKKQKDRLSDEKASTDDVQRQIDDLSKELEFKKKSLETDLSDIDIRLDRGRECLDARVDVQSAFKSAIENGNHENDPDIKVKAKELVEYWESKREGHEKQIQAVKEGIEKCNKCKSGDL